MEMMDTICEELKASILTKERILQSQKLVCEIKNVAECLISIFENNGKLLVCGNGGSACDALHMAGELVGRFRKERRAYTAIALNADVASLTAISNDYGYAQVFARQVEGLMNAKDALIGLSTSGNSENVIAAFKMANKKGGKTILFSGGDGGKLKTLSNFSIIVPSEVTSHVQEAHETIIHILCGLIEDILY